MQICETPLAFLSGFIAKIIIIIAIKNDCALKSPVFCVPRVFHPRHSAIHLALTAYGAGLMGDSCSFDKNTPHGHLSICDLWACSPTCFFKRIERLVFTPTDPADLHRCVIPVPHGSDE